MRDQAFTELCWLLEQPDPRLEPDAIWRGDRMDVYRHLREVGALSLSNDLTAGIVCPDCCGPVIEPNANTDDDRGAFPYRGYCPDCGWIRLRPDQARLWLAHSAKIAGWLASALHLTSRSPPDAVVPDVLWRLGEAEYRRRRLTLFFGRHLVPSAAIVRDELDRQVAPGAEVIITSSDPVALTKTVLGDRLTVPLRAVAHLRKAGLVVENLDAYLTGMVPTVNTRETSLRLLHSKRVALIEGLEHKVPPQLHGLLTVLEEFDGDEVHKRHLAERLGIEPEKFRLADIIKRHRLIFEVFAEADQKGHYWLKPEFATLVRR